MSIRQRRLDKGWSQEELARHSGLSCRTIQRIESGQKAGLESLKSLAAVFETSVSALMQEQNPNKQTSSQDVENNLLNQIEKEAIDFAQSIIKGPSNGDKDCLTKLERNAISYAQSLLRKFDINK